MERIGTIIFVICAATAGIQAYPKVEMSFRAVGNMYVPTGGSKESNLQITFEENYRSDVKQAALTTLEFGLNSTVLEHVTEKLALRFQGKTCETLNTKDIRFETDISFVRLDKTGQYVMPVHQLLSLDVKWLVAPEPLKVVYRGIPAQKWTFNITSQNASLLVDAYWSAPDVKTASAKPEIPLGFEIRQTVRNAATGIMETTKQNIRLELFTPDEFNYQVFLPRRGVYCARARDPTVFREIVKNKLETLRTKIEQVVKDFRQVGVIDTWFDPANKIYQVNFSPRKERIQKGIQRIISKVQGVIYEVRETKKCVVKSVKDAVKDFDHETIFNPLSDSSFSMNGFFGVEETTYVSAGQTIERGIPCNLYQGQRTDWPPNVKGVTTLWEWCIANQVLPDVKLEVNGFPLVSLNIYVTESPFTKEDSLFYTGLQLAYNFYDVRNSTKEYLDNLAFDIKDCFEDANQKILLFRSKIQDEVTRKLIERNARHKAHVAAWKAAIAQAAKLAAGSLRISTVQTRLNASELEVSFTLLGRHPDLPKEVQEIPLEEAVTNVKRSLDKGEITVNVELGSDAAPQKVNLKGEPGTLRSKTVVEETAGASGLSAGAMAAVAVVMLALGAAVGAAFIFMKKRRMYQKL